MEKLYPIVKKQKTCLGQPIAANDPYDRVLLYCPVCGKRLSAKKLHPAKCLWNYTERKKKSENGMVGKPTYCEKCGSLIHPLS